MFLGSLQRSLRALVALFRADRMSPDQARTFYESNIRDLGYPGLMVEKLGRIYEKDGRYADAIELYSDYLHDFRLKHKPRWSPSVIHIARSRSQCFEVSGNFAAARESLLELRFIVPRDLDSDRFKYDLGRLQFNMGKFREAIDELDNLSDPVIRRVANDALLQSYVYINDFDQAERILSQSEHHDRYHPQLKPPPPVEKSARAKLYSLYASGEYKKCLLKIDEAKEIAGADDLRLNLIEILAYARLGEYQKSRKILNYLRSKQSAN